MSKTFNCPNCGAEQEPAFASVRMMTCAYCDTTLFADDSQFRDLGHAGDMHDAPQLFRLGEHVRLAGAEWHVLGHARYSYGRGHWDEYWCENRSKGAWISVDEGDVVVQRPIDPSDAPSLKYAPRLQARVEIKGHSGSFTVTEREEATCQAVRGSFPELLEVGEVHTFINAEGEHGDLLSGEFWDGGQNWFVGSWVDPFTVKSA